MKNHEEELIDDYLLGRLDTTGRREVEQRALRDPEFASELALRRDILRGIELSGESALRNKIAALDAKLAEQGFFSEKKSTLGFVRGGLFSKTMYAWAAAAAVLVIVAAASWFFFTNRPSNAPQMADTPPKPLNPETPKPQNPETPKPLNPETPKPRNPDDSRYLALARAAYTSPDFSGLRTAGNGATSLMGQASESFEKKDFNRVFQLLDTVSTTSPSYWQALEIRAHARYRSGQTARAAGHFRQLAQSGRLPFSERAEWFLLLCLTENHSKNVREIESLRKKIMQDPGHPFFEATENLSRQMR